jgi:hypothetical protein
MSAEGAPGHLTGDTREDNERTSNQAIRRFLPDRQIASNPASSALLDT